jgi:CheY-like chemotaxis protein
MTTAKLSCLVNLTEQPPSSLISEGKKSQSRILLIEDNPCIQLIHQDMLTNLGCSVDIVSTGEEALIKLKQEDYDLVLLDIGLPGMSGIEVMVEFNSYRNYPKTPVIVLTTFTDQTLIKRCLSIGIKQVLHKPVNVSELKEVIHLYT